MAGVKVYTTRVCPFCQAVKRLLDDAGVPYDEVSLDDQPELRERLSRENGGWRTVPMVFVDGAFVGGFQEVNELRRTGSLAVMNQR